VLVGRSIRATGAGGRGAEIGCGGGKPPGEAGAGDGMLMRATGTGAGGGEAGARGGAGVGRDTLILGAGVGAADPVETRACTGGGRAISGAGAATTGNGAAPVGDTDSATGPVTFPNSCRTASLRRADKSNPQSGHANVTGWRTISGEASKAYFAPQSHRIFIRVKVWD